MNMVDSMKEKLFVSGVARSGTSALVNVLNCSPGFLIGMERFFFLIKREQISGAHFRRQRFLSVEEGDCHGKGLTMEDPAVAFGRARYIGDKFPLLYQNFDYIFDTFPEAHHIYIVRNPLSVMESYDARKRDAKDTWKKTGQVGLEEWNESVRKVALLPADRLKNFYFVQYENFFADTGLMNLLFRSFGLDPVKEARLEPFCEKFKELNERPVARDDDMRQHVARNAEWEAYRHLLGMIDAQHAKGRAVETDRPDSN